MSDVSQWSPTDANNNAAPPDGFPEGMPASTVNDASRAVMGGVRRQAEQGGWFDWGHSATYVSGTMFQVPGDLSAIYASGRRVRATQTTTITGTIQSTAVGANTDVTVVWDSGALANEALAIALGPEQPAILPGSLGTAAALDAGTAIGNVVQLEDVGGSAGMPAVDGSQLSGIAFPGWKILAQVTANGSTGTYSFDTAAWFTEFDHFRIEFDGLVPATDGAGLWIRLSTDGGTSYIATTQYRNLEHTLDGLAAVATFVADRDRFGPAGQIANTVGYGVWGFAEMRGMSAASCGLRSHAVWNRTGVPNNISCTDLSGYMNAGGGPFNAFQVLADTGLWASGGFRVFGIRRTV